MPGSVSESVMCGLPHRAQRGYRGVARNNCRRNFRIGDAAPKHVRISYSDKNYEYLRSEIFLATNNPEFRKPALLTLSHVEVGMPLKYVVLFPHLTPRLVCPPPAISRGYPRGPPHVSFGEGLVSIFQPPTTAPFVGAAVAAATAFDAAR